MSKQLKWWHLKWVEFKLKMLPKSSYKCLIHVQNATKILMQVQNATKTLMQVMTWTKSEIANIIRGLNWIIRALNWFLIIWGKQYSITLKMISMHAWTLS